MDLQSIIPSTEAIPASWWLFELLGLVTLMIHLLLANVVVGGTLLATVGLFRGGSRAIHGTRPGDFVRATPTMIALAVNLGVAPLLFVQVTHGHLIYTSSILMAVYWLAVPLVLIVAYYSAYYVKHRDSRPDLQRPAALVSLLLLLFIAFVFVNNMTLMLQPERWMAYADTRTGTLLNTSDPVVWPRLLHFIVASVAVAGLFVALKDEVAKRRGREPRQGARQGGLRLFAVATLVQALVGIWLLVHLPQEVRNLFLGGDVLRTAVLTLGVVLGLGSAAMAWRGKLGATCGLLLSTVFLMVLARSLVRSSYLAEHFSATSLEVRSQSGPLFLFLAIFAAGIATLVYMARKVWKARKGER